MPSPFRSSAFTGSGLSVTRSRAKPAQVSPSQRPQGVLSAAHLRRPLAGEPVQLCFDFYRPAGRWLVASEPTL